MFEIKKVIIQKCVLINILLLLFCSLQVVSFAQSTDDKSIVRVMTFNIRYNEPKDKENSWDNRKTKVAGVIRFHHADLIGVQEALIEQLKDLETLLPDYAWCGVGRSDGKTGGEFSAIIYRKSRFNLLESATFWLSETPDKAGSKGWDANLPRIVTWARFEDKQTGKQFFQFNTHFDHIGEKARLESAKLLLTQIEKLAKDSLFVVTGDFNAKESTEIYKTLAGVSENKNSKFKLKDARYISLNEPFGPTSTFNGFGSLVPDYKIDYIFVKEGMKVLEHGVLADQWDGRWASDHLPILAEIIIR